MPDLNEAIKFGSIISMAPTGYISLHGPNEAFTFGPVIAPTRYLALDPLPIWWAVAPNVVFHFESVSYIWA